MYEMIDAFMGSMLIFTRLTRVTLCKKGMVSMFLLLDIYTTSRLNVVQ
jgi:hypothetical protein